MKMWIVLLSLALTAGMIGMAQRPTEWRPSIAEDNKAATIEDTMAFLVTTLRSLAVVQPANITSNGCVLVASYVTERTRIGVTFSSSTGKVEVVEPGSPADKAGIQTHDLVTAIDHISVKAAKDVIAEMAKVKPGASVKLAYERSGKKRQIRIVPAVGSDASTYAFEMKQIDPVTITVKAYSWGSAVDFAGTNNGPVVSATYRWRPGEDRAHAVADSAAFATCAAGDRSCQSDQGLRPTNNFTFKELESAKRDARALLHAALLCGGTKAVSPF